MYEIKPVIGRDENGTVYDTENILRHADETAALNDAAQLGVTSDVFAPTGERIARAHVDGGIDRF